MLGMFLLPLAAFNVEGAMALMIPIIIMMIPIVAILTKHQRDMATLYHNRNSQQAGSAEVEALRRQVEELRQLVAQQTLALDDIRMTQRQLAATHTEALQQRLENP